MIRSNPIYNLRYSAVTPKVHLIFVLVWKVSEIQKQIQSYFALTNTFPLLVSISCFQRQVRTLGLSLIDISKYSFVIIFRRVFGVQLQRKHRIPVK
jgi:hypothetical protein